MGMFKTITGSVALMAAAAFSTPAMSAEILLNTSGTASGSGRIFTDGDTNVRVSAWSISNSVVRNARLGIYSEGAGVINKGGDNSHTVDNSGWSDFLLLQFDQTVQLTNATFRTGWHGMNDTDATIGYANSLLNIASQPALDGVSFASLSAIGNLFASNSKPGNNTRNVNPNGFTGNTWLIGASFDNPDHGADGFKLRGIQFDNVVPTAPVPEPATWALMLLGFAAVGGAMRSRKSAGQFALTS